MIKRIKLYMGLAICLAINPIVSANGDAVRNDGNVLSSYISGVGVELSKLVFDQKTQIINETRFHQEIENAKDELYDIPELREFIVSIRRQVTQTTTLEEYMRIVEVESENVRIKTFNSGSHLNNEYSGISSETSRTQYRSFLHIVKVTKAIFIKETIKVHHNVSKSQCEKNDYIHKAAARGKFGYVAECLSAGVNPNIKEGNGWTPIHSAARYGHMNIIKLLVNYGANINTPDVTQRTPLDQAVISDNIFLVEYLKSLGARMR